jgi:glycosyltransferase involved in cell wall biosynthesis
MNSDQRLTTIDHSVITSVAAPITGQAQVAILLATLNGQSFLSQQLESIARQTYAAWHVYASDDGSKDDTLSLLQRYQNSWGQQRLTISRGPQRGFTANFLSLVCQPEIIADFYAYADQDDIWYSDKLSRALQWFKTLPASQPALYCSRTCLLDAQGRPVGLSHLFRRPPSFAHALLQVIAGGNTMVFNQAARRLLCTAGSLCEAYSHDWWTYLLVSGCGGAVFYDKTPTVGYRQHDHNVFGSNRAWRAKFSRAKKLLQGQFRRANVCNLRALQPMQPYLSLENRQLFQQFCAAREQEGWFSRLLAMRRCHLYRQTCLDNLGLIVAIVLNKI